MKEIQSTQLRLQHLATSLQCVRIRVCNPSNGEMKSPAEAFVYYSGSFDFGFPAVSVIIIILIVRYCKL